MDLCGSSAMHCDEIRESFADLLYDDPSEASPEVKAHLQTCAECRQELDDLKQTQKYLQGWKDESPLRSVSMARQELKEKRINYWKLARYGAIAAMVLLCFLALANTELTWTKDGFSFRTSLFRRAPDDVSYSKSEVRDLVKRALDDSEMRTNEQNYLMIQKMLDTVEQNHWLYSRTARVSAARSGNRN